MDLLNTLLGKSIFEHNYLVCIRSSFKIYNQLFLHKTYKQIGMHALTDIITRVRVVVQRFVTYMSQGTT
jgi:hypothetical protein